jgi:hypothetical protein
MEIKDGNSVIVSSWAFNCRLCYPETLRCDPVYCLCLRKPRPFIALEYLIHSLLRMRNLVCSQTLRGKQCQSRLRSSPPVECPSVSPCLGKDGQQKHISRRWILLGHQALFASRRHHLEMTEGRRWLPVSLQGSWFEFGFDGGNDDWSLDGHSTFGCNLPTLVLCILARACDYEGKGSITFTSPEEGEHSTYVAFSAIEGTGPEQEGTYLCSRLLDKWQWIFA